MHGNEINFHDDLDWEVVKDQGVWTDVYFQCGGSSVFAFTINSSFAARGYMTGSVPEAIRNNETGLWDLYIHKKYISHDDVCRACKKWIELQAPIKGIVCGCNVNFNGKRCGHVWAHEQYPREEYLFDLYDDYKVAAFCNPVKLHEGGICG